MIRVACPKCKEINRRPDEDAGRVVACSACEEELRVPASKERESEPGSSKPPEKPLDDLEVVSEPGSRRKAKPEDDEDQDEDEDDRPRKKKRKTSELLGPRKATFEPRKGLLRALLVAFAVTGVAGVVFFVLALAGPMVESGVALALFTIPTGIIGSLWCLNVLTLEVVLHKGGLAHTHRGRRRLIPWEEIRSVKQAITEHYTNGAYSGTTYHYTLELDDGSRIVYTNYRLQKVEKLGKAIMDRTSRVILPRALRAYEKGKVVDFGPLGVSQDGLHHGRSLLEWRDIKGVKIHEGCISVSKRGKWLNWCNVSASSVPNLLVFLSLVNQIVGVEDE